MAPSQALSEERLAQQWAERVKSGQFSPAVLGLGTIRVMGRSGDAPVVWPRIESLDALGTLAPDEQWAVRVAEQIVAQAQQQDRTVHQVLPANGSTPPQPTRITAFDPAASNLVVVSAIRGG